jgi:hypothetical protein
MAGGAYVLRQIICFLNILEYNNNINFFLFSTAAAVTVRTAISRLKKFNAVGETA